MTKSNYTFQKNIVNKAINKINNGQSPVIQSPPGSGKTNIALEIARKLGLNTLIVVPFKEIQKQIQNQIVNDKKICVYTIAKLQNYIPKNIEFIIFDEAHHAVAATYRRMKSQYPNAKVLGITGTLSRMDGQGFTDIFDTIIEGPSVKELIQKNVLAPYKLYAPNINIPLFNKTRLNLTTKGEYSTQTLVEAIDVKKAYAASLTSYKRLANNKTMILYAPSVELAYKFADNFEKNGISSDVLHSQQSPITRNRIIDKFRNKKIKILCNYNVISEGFNMPDCDGVILLRPTRSLSLYMQQAMRAMRYQPNKTAIIIDHTLNSQIFGTPTSKHLWRLEGKLDDQEAKKQQDDNLNTILEKRFTIDILVNLNQLSDMDLRIVQKNKLISEIEQAIKANSFTELIKIQKKYNIGYIKNMAWAYKMALTYNIPLPTTTLAKKN